MKLWTSSSPWAISNSCSNQPQRVKYRMRLSMHLFINIFLFLVFAPLSFAQQRIYWTTTENDNSIYRSNLDGSSIQKIIDANINDRETSSIVIDDQQGKIFWINPKDNQIRKANLDGTVEELFYSAANGITDLNIDLPGRKLYWVDVTVDRVCRSDIDLALANAECTSAYPVADIAVAPALSTPTLFFDTTAAGIRAAALTPFGGASNVVSNDDNPIGMTFIHGLEKLVWYNLGAEEIRMRALSDVSDISFLPIFSGGSPRYFATDRAEQTLFWIEDSNLNLVKSSLQSPVAQVIGTLPSNATGLAVSCGRFAPDTDSDGSPDCDDSCPNDTAKLVPGTCGCGAADVDTDSDGILNCLDSCPVDGVKTQPGTCGCGVAESGADSDFDETPDCLDLCPVDPKKITAGGCGCGFSEVNNSGKISCTDDSEVDPNTRLIVPEVQVNNDDNSITLILQEFDKAVLKKKKVQPGGSPAFLAARSKVTFRYNVTIKNTAKKNDIRTLNSKRNELTVKNLKPGNYNVSYRAEIFQEGNPVGQTKFSPKSNFTIQ